MKYLVLLFKLAIFFALAQIRLGLNVVQGKVVYQGVADAFGLPLATVDSVMSM